MSNIPEKDLKSSESSEVVTNVTREEFLLAGLLKSRIAEILPLIDSLEKHDFAVANQGRFDFLKEQLLLDPELDVAAMIAKSPEPEYWQNLYLLDTGDFKLEVLTELASNLKRESLKKEMSQLSKLMHQAELANDEAKLTNLKDKFQEVRDKLALIG